MSFVFTNALSLGLGTFRDNVGFSTPDFGCDFFKIADSTFANNGLGVQGSGYYFTQPQPPNPQPTPTSTPFKYSR